MITYWAPAISRASAGARSSEWGSVFGFTITLVKWARSPPSWVAMLPQKFSAATTSTLPPVDVDEAPVNPHTLRERARSAPMPARSPALRPPPATAQEYCTIDLRNVNALEAVYFGPCRGQAP